MEPKCPFKYNTKEYRAFKSKHWYAKKKESDPEWYQEQKNKRSLDRQQKKSNYVKKFGSKCLDCQNTFIDCVFEFHHLDPETKIHTDPSKVFMFSDKRIEEELAKCIMLCANCHRIRHNQDKYKAHEKRNKYGQPE